MNQSRINIRLVIILVVIMLILTSCQETPNKQIVIAKTDEAFREMLENAGVLFDGDDIQYAVSTLHDNLPEPKKPSEEYRTPNHLQYSISLNNTTVNIDADIIVPEYAVPIYMLEPARMEYQMIEILFEALKTEGVLYDYYFATTADTKQTIQAQIDEYMQYIKWLNENKAYYTEEEFEQVTSFAQQEINKLSIELDTAPESYDDAAENIIGEQSFDMSRTITEDMVLPIDINEANFDDKNYRLLIGDLHSKNMLNIAAADNYRRQQLIFLDNAVNYFKEDVNQQEANDIIQPFLNALNGITVQKIENGDSYLRYICKRYYSGIESNIVHAMPNGWVNQGDAENYLNGMPSEMMDFEKYYAQEKLEISIDADGNIIEFAYESPMLPTKVLTEDAKLIPFDEIQKIFERYIVLNGFTQEENVTIYIDKIKLGMMRIDIPDSDLFLAIPVWDFYGGFKIEDWMHGIDESNNTLDMTDIEDGSFLTINALNGAVIDRSNGY